MRLFTKAKYLHEQKSLYVSALGSIPSVHYICTEPVSSESVALILQPGGDDENGDALGGGGGVSVSRLPLRTPIIDTYTHCAWVCGKRDPNIPPAPTPCHIFAHRSSAANLHWSFAVETLTLPADRLRCARAAAAIGSLAMARQYGPRGWKWKAYFFLNDLFRLPFQNDLFPRKHSQDA